MMMDKKKLIGKIIDYAIYAGVLYSVAIAFNYCSTMMNACGDYDYTYWKQNNITLVMCDCPCNANITDVNGTYMMWPDPINYPYVYSVLLNPAWLPNENFEKAVIMVRGMERWREIYG